MGMWIAILLVIMLLTAIAVWYVYRETASAITNVRKKPSSMSRSARLASILTVGVLFAILAACLKTINAVIVFYHLAAVWALVNLLLHLIRRFVLKNPKKWISPRAGGAVALALTLGILSWGWYLDHHVWRTEYSLSTRKNVPPLKILMFADSHLGATFDEQGFARHLETMRLESPDLVLIAGDYVDDDTTRDEMIASTRELGKLKSTLGTYYIFGNHDKGYYGSEYRGFSADDLVKELKRAGVHVLEDASVDLGGGIVIVGRRDLSEKKEKHLDRMSAADLLAMTDPNSYSIVLDHQPADYAALAAAGADLVLSGHTHGGQLFPFNAVGLLIGAVDRVYGYERRDNADFIVTSGISDWAIRFKTGTFSEYVVINLIPEGDDAADAKAADGGVAQDVAR